MINDNSIVNLDELIKQVKLHVSIPIYFVDVIDSSVDLTVNRSQPCPLHEETVASFRYYPDTDSFYCFGCRKGGDVIDLCMYVEQKEDQSFNRLKAVIWLAKAYGIKFIESELSKFSKEYKFTSKKKHFTIDVNNILEDNMSIVKLNEDIEFLIKSKLRSEMDDLEVVKLIKIKDIIYQADILDDIKINILTKIFDKLKQ